jgi:serine/threonine protein kinase
MSSNGTESSKPGSSGKGGFVPPSTDDLDAILDQYEFLDLLGRGGMGAVYKARQKSLDRMVAIKILPPNLTTDEEEAGFHFSERFQREAKAMAKLNHPHIIGVYDFGQAKDGQYYFVMEYVEGTDLHALIKGGEMTTAHVTGWMSQICEALQYAHEKGIVHRDIKPANIMITREGQVKVADFGLAKLAGGDAAEQTKLTMTNMAMGTPDYVAPEALEIGVEVDHRADLYALGVMLYEMLTGKVPRGAWKAPSAQIAGLDERFDGLIERAMDSDRESRIQQASEISATLYAIATTPAKAARPKLAMGTAPVKATPEKKEATRPQKAPESSKLTGPREHTRPQATPGRGRPREGEVPVKKPMNPALLISGLTGGAALVGLGVFFTLFKGSGDPAPPAPHPTPLIGEAPPVPAQPAPVSPPKSVPVPQKPAPPTPSPATSPALPVGGVDLLASVDLTRDVLSGEWSHGPDGLMIQARNTDSPTGEPRLQFEHDAPEEYDLETEFTPTAGEGGVALNLRAGDSPARLVLDLTNNKQTFFSGFARIRDKGIEEATEGTVQRLEPLPNGTRARLRVEVRRGELRAFLNGEPLVSWSGDFQALSVRPSQAMRDPRRLGLAAFRRAVTFHRVTLTAPGGLPDVPSPAGNDLTFNGHRYRLVVEKDMLTWAAAQAKAGALGGHLAAITSREERDWIHREIGAKKERFFIGAIRKGSKTTPWEWVTGEPFQQGLWEGNGPNDQSDSTLVGTYYRKEGWDDVGQGFKTDAYLIKWGSAADPMATPPGAPPEEILTFNGHRYQFFPDILTWPEARTRAENIGGHLATIGSKEENDWIATQFVSKLPPGKALWLGGTYDETTGQWSWVTGEPFEFTQWGASEPTNTANEPALQFSHSDKNGPEWGDIKVNGMGAADRRGGYLVEWDSESGPGNPPSPPSEVLTHEGHRYQFHPGAYTWTEAKARAEALGGHLATPQTKNETEWIIQTFAVPWLQHRHLFWIDGRIDSAASGWKWHDDSPAIVTTWGGGRPYYGKPGQNLTYPGYLALRKYNETFGVEDCQESNNSGAEGWPSRMVGFLVEWDTPPPTTAAPVPAMPDDPRVAQLDAGFNGRYQADAEKPYQTALAALNQSYAANGIARARATAQQAGKLDDITALDAEKALVESGQPLPDTDPETLSAAVKALRATYRAAHAKLLAERDAKAAPLYDLYLGALDAYIAELTKADVIEKAKAVKAWRDAVAARKASIAAAGGAPVAIDQTPPAPASVATVTPPAPAPVAPTAIPTKAGGNVDRRVAEHLIALGGSCKATKTGGGFDIARPDDIPNGRFTIISIHLDRFGSSRPPLKDADLQPLIGLDDLRAFDTRPYGVLTDAAYAFLAGNRELTSINIHGAQPVTDALLEHLAASTKLEKLGVQFAPRFTGRGLAGKPFQKTLTSVDFSECGIDDAGLAALAACPELKRINVKAGAGTDAGFALLGQLKELQSLDVNNTQFGDQAAAAIAGLPNLKTLNVENTKITDQGLAALATAKNLESLVFRNLAVTEAGIAALVKALPKCRIDY